MALIIGNLLIFTGHTSAKTYSGKCGANAYYTYTSDGVLTITGTGKVSWTLVEEGDFKDPLYGTKKIVVGEGITELQECFGWLYNVTEVQLPSSLKVLGKDCMSNMLSLKHITIPEGVTTIDERAFLGCESLADISFPDSIQTINNNAFNYCISLTSVKLPKGLKVLNEGVFSDCKKLSKIQWPDGLTVLKDAAFSSCDSLRSVVLPDSVTTLNGAFSSCQYLSTLTVGKGLQKTSKKYLDASIGLRKIVNLSGISLPLPSFGKKMTWYVDQKKSSSLQPGKTAYGKGKKYKISYSLNKGKIKGKKVKSHEFGKDTKLPNAYRKGYTFIGWTVWAKEDFACLASSIANSFYGSEIYVDANFKKYKVTSKNRRISVLVRDPDYKKKGYKKSTIPFIIAIQNIRT